MATKKSASSASQLEAEVALLRKEVAALKKQCAAQAAGGSDPRLDKFLEAFRAYSTKWRNILEKAGL